MQCSLKKSVAYHFFFQILQAANGHEECVDALIHHGADLSLRDNLGRSAVHMSAVCGHMALLSTLLNVSVLL